MTFGNAPIWEMHENPWDPIPGELPIRIHPDYDLGVPLQRVEGVFTEQGLDYDLNTR